MPRKPEEEIERKLAELETALRETEPQAGLAAAEKRKTLVSGASLPSKDTGVRGDLYMLGGFALAGLGLFMLLSHIRVTTGLMHIFGMGGGGGGMVVLPLLVGIGIMFYDFKNKLGWALCAGGIALLLFVVLSQLILYFPTVSLLGLICIFVPLCAGAAFVFKGMKLNKKIELVEEKEKSE